MQMVIQTNRQIFSTHIFLLFIDRSHPNYTICNACVEGARYGNTGKSEEWNPDTADELLLFSNKVPLVIDRSQTNVRHL